MLQNMDIDKEMDVISLTSYFSGDFSFGKYTRIEGKIDGNIKSSGLLIIGEQALVNADISGSLIVIYGTVTGDITAERNILIQSTANVSGNIKAPAVTIMDGAKINGQISMSKYHSNFFKQLELAC
ncbi:MAG: polymer-forming cytoskeletal protein [Proteobacteria bacterium]|nr:polymer-forming cytoskeletal protein [Pseudomonadota bacterium]